MVEIHKSQSIYINYRHPYEPTFQSSFCILQTITSPSIKILITTINSRSQIELFPVIPSEKHKLRQAIFFIKWEFPDNIFGMSILVVLNMLYDSEIICNHSYTMETLSVAYGYQMWKLIHIKYSPKSLQELLSVTCLIHNRQL